MPELTAILLAEQYRAELLKAESASAVRLVNAYGTIYKRLLLQMDALTADLDRIAAKGEAPTRWQLQRLDRFRAIKAQVLDEMQRYAAGVEIEIEQGARSAIAAAGKNGHDLVEASLPGVAEIDARIMASWQTLDTDAVETMVGFLDPRSPLKQGLRTMYGATIADGVERGLLESIALGYNPRKLAATFTRDLGMGLVSSLRLSRTVQLNAYREATRAGYAANPEIVKGWKWRAARDSRTCFPAGVLANGPRPVAATERFYEGDLVTIRTASGKELSFTPNHPILARQGWVAGGTLRVGDYVFSSPNSKRTSLLFDKDDYQVPTRVEEIAHSFDVIAIMPTAAPDFHGDGKGSKVDIVRADRLLSKDGHAHSLQPQAQLPFCGRDVPGWAGNELRATLVSLGAVNSFGYRDSMDRLELLGLLNRRIARTQLLGTQARQEGVGGFLGASYGNATHAQRRQYGRPADFIGASQADRRLSLDIARANLGIGEAKGGVSFGGLSLRAGVVMLDFGAQQPPRAQFADESLAAYAEAGRDALRTLAGEVRADRIVEVGRRSFCGHVYSLQTTKHWMLANDIIASNCASCLAMDGTVHPVTERLADHWQGRCVATPVCIDYADLGLDVPPRQPTDQWLASLPQDQQRAYLGPKRYDAWKSGDLRFSETGRQWFERQPEAAQRAQMGSGKWEAWRAGKFGFEELSIRVPDRIWGVMRVETPLKTLLKKDEAAAV